MHAVCPRRPASSRVEVVNAQARVALKGQAKTSHDFTITSPFKFLPLVDLENSSLQTMLQDSDTQDHDYDEARRSCRTSG